MIDVATLTAFLFTDIEGSSLKWLNRRAAMQGALAEHDRILRAAIAAHEGEVFKTAGDAFFAAFKRPSDAANAAISAQKALAAHDWSAVDGLKVRMAVHCGTAEKRESDWFGPALNRCARLLALSHGGQVLITAATAELLASEREVKDPSRLVGTHPLDDPAQPVAIHQVLITGLPQDFPPLRAPETRPTNLPRHLTPLIGREKELQAVKDLLAANRLVTLTGPGGVGKTRLAIEAGLELLPQFTNGVWLVELAPLSDAQLVVSAVGTGLRLDLSGNRLPRDILISHLENQDILIVLDNCEHLVDAVAELAEALLAGTPRVCILASSQELIGLPGEQVLRVPSLAVPDNAAPGAEEALKASAVQMFVERVRAADPKFLFDDKAASVAANICKRLDGVPLALEMAAARVPALGLDAVAQGLDDRFRLLTGGKRTALPRQRTLHAALDWSHALLSEKDRIVFRRLGQFAGGFTLRAATAVVGDDVLRDHDVVDCLADLVAKSLVIAEATPTGARYRLLETMRAYALEKLGEVAENDTIARKHAVAMRTILDDSVDKWFQIPAEAWRAQYVPELENLRESLNWAFGPNGNSELAIALVGGGYDLWDACALYAERRQRHELAATRIDSTTPSAVEARFWFTFGNVLLIADPQRARVALERSARLYRQIGDHTGLIRALYISAIVYAFVLGETDRAEAALQEAKPLMQHAGQISDQAWYYAALAHLNIARSDLQGAYSACETSIRLARSVGAIQALNNSEIISADVLLRSQRNVEAAELLRGLLARMRHAPFADTQRLFFLLMLIVEALTETGEHDEATPLARELVTVSRRIGVVRAYFESFVWRMAKIGRYEVAARLKGWAEQNPGVRAPRDEHKREFVGAVLRRSLAADLLEHLIAAGAEMSEDEACQLAMQS